MGLHRRSTGPVHSGWPAAFPRWSCFHRWHRRHGGQAGLAGLDDFHHFRFLQSFTYAEIAGLFPGKSGGTSIYGAVAWVRYVKFIAPMSVWCNWFAWSPVLAIGSDRGRLPARSVSPPDAAINTWHVALLDLGVVKGAADDAHQRDLLHRPDLMLSCSPSSMAASCVPPRRQIMGIAAVLSLC